MLNLPRIKKLEYFNTLDMTYAFDDLTGLFNNASMIGYVNSLIEREVPFTMAIVNADDFKNINSTYGYVTGDKILQIYAKALTRAVSDDGVIGRYGGDEFIVVLENITEYNDIWKIFHELNVMLSETTVSGMEELSISVTTGITRYPLDGRTSEELFSTAQRALFRGKTKGKACFIIYLAAKHANIVVEKATDNIFSTTELISKVFDYLNVNHKSLKNNINELLSYFQVFFKLDHVVLESNTKIICEKTRNNLDKKFRYIGPKVFKDNLNIYGLFFVNNRRALLQIGAVDLHKALHDQEIRSTIAVEIGCNGEKYGILRADMINNTAAWKDNEMIVFVATAKLIGTLIYKASKTLDEI